MPYNSINAFANVAASSTDASVVAALPGQSIRVMAFSVMAAATATNVTFNTKPAGSGSPISCLYPCGANGGIAPPKLEDGWFTTNAGEGLSVTTGTGSTVGIQISYVKI